MQESSDLILLTELLSDRYGVAVLLVQYGGKFYVVKLINDPTSIQDYFSLQVPMGLILCNY